MYAIAFLLLFAIGGLTGIFLGTLSTDVHLTDTYFVVAHFHYVMMGGTVIAFIGGLHYWWPKMTGRMYNENLGPIGCVLVFVGFNLTFLLSSSWAAGHAAPLLQLPGSVRAAAPYLHRRDRGCSAAGFFITLFTCWLRCESRWMRPIIPGAERRSNGRRLRRRSLTTLKLSRCWSASLTITGRNRWTHVMSTTTVDVHDPHDDGHGDHQEDDPHHQHHFATMEQQFDTIKIGMWLFLATEVLLFGGLVRRLRFDAAALSA